MSLSLTDAPAASDTAIPGLGRGLTFALAAGAGVAVANIYYNQPMLGLISGEVGPDAGWIPPVTQFGYAAGLFLLVPLADGMERRRLIFISFILLAAALALAALAPGVGLMLVAALLVGLFSTVAQQILPLAAHLAAPARRGATVGTVMAGLLTGILLSRTLAGLVASAAGWRAMFWLAVPLALGMAALLRWRLPHTAPEQPLAYGAALRSLGRLWREFPALRRASLTQALLFAGFSAFWSVLALRLQAPPFGFGPDIAGLFGILGLIGIAAAPLAGRSADRRGPGPVILVGTGLVLLSWLLFGLLPGMAGLVLGVLVLDFALQAVLVAHQHLVYALRPAARARLNTLFMGSMFLGGAAGSAAGLALWDRAGWSGLCLLGGGLALIAALVQIGSRRRTGRD